MFTGFSKKNVLDLAIKSGYPRGNELPEKLVEWLNGAADQFLSVAWPLQRSPPNSALKLQLRKVRTAATKLHKNLNDDVLVLIGNGLIQKRRPLGLPNQDPPLKLARDVLQALLRGIDEGSKILEEEISK